MQPETLREIAGALRYGPPLTDYTVLCNVLENAADYIDHLRDLSARLATQEDKSGYHPFVAEGGGKQVLVSVFTDESGAVDVVQLAFRENTWDTWSPPMEAEKA